MPPDVDYRAAWLCKKLRPSCGRSRIHFAKNGKIDLSLRLAAERARL
jgi:hypothetical protein